MSGKKFVEYTQRYDQEPVHKESRNIYYEACCDCGLVHKTTYLGLEDGSVIVVSARSSAATAARRRSTRHACTLKRGRVKV